MHATPCALLSFFFVFLVRRRPSDEENVEEGEGERKMKRQRYIYTVAAVRTRVLCEGM